MLRIASNAKQIGVPTFGEGGQNPKFAPKKNYRLPLKGTPHIKKGEGGWEGERGNLGNARKKTFFLCEVFPKYLST